MSGPVGSNDFQSQSSAFLTWLVQRGASISPNIELMDLRNRNAGRGVVATAALPTDTELFRIPRTAILTPSTSTLPPASLASLSDPWLTLILAMIHESQLGARSPWKPYLDIVPSTFDTPMFWTPAELSALTGSAVLDKVGHAGADERFTRELLPRLRTHAEEFGVRGLGDAELLALCHRMGSAIMAYAFDLEDESSEARTRPDGEDDGWEEDPEEETGLLPKGMVPLADMLNADADRNNARLFYEDDHVVMKTVVDVAAGDELFNDYGPLPRADVLRRYGYITDNYAKYDVVEVSLEFIKARARESQGALTVDEVEARVGYLNEQGILDDAYDIARLENEDGQFPEELCGLVNTLTSTQEDFDKMRRKEKLPKPDLTDPAMSLLYSIVVHRYAMYPVPGTAMIADGDRRSQMATSIIDGEREVLREAAQTLTQTSTNSKKRRAHTLEEEAQLIRNPSKK